MSSYKKIWSNDMLEMHSKIKSRFSTSNSYFLKFKFLRNSKIQTRLMVSFLVLSIIPVAMIGSFSYYLSCIAVDSKIRTYSEQVVSSEGRNIENGIAKFSDIASEISVDKDVQSKIRSLKNADDSDKHSVQMDIISVLTSRFSLLKPVIGVSIVTTNKDSFSYGITEGIYDDDYGKFYEKAKSSDGYFTWSSQKSTQGELCIYTRVIKNLSNGEDLGYINVIVRESSLSDIYKDVNIGDGASLFIIDSKGSIISSKNPKVIGNEFKDGSGIQGIKENISKKFNTFQFNNGLLTYKQLNGTAWLLVGEIPSSYLNKETNRIASFLVVIIICCLVLAIFLSFIISRSISNPLGKLVNLMKEAKKGNLSISIKDESKDEIADVTRNFNEMVLNIKLLISSVNSALQRVMKNSEDVTDSSDKYFKSSEQIAMTMQEVAKGAANQAEDSIKSVDNMNILSEGINKVVQDIDSVSRIVLDTGRLSETALQSVKLLNEQVVQTNQVSQRIIEDIKSLGIDLKQIKNITRVIVGITEQTNLLALNAAIEAARAGEAGRGFTVVAEEVKKLAEQSKNASISINNIISSINSKTEKTVGAAIDASLSISQEMEAVKETDGAFRIIFEGMQGISNNISNVMESIKKTWNIKDQTILSIENISSVSEQAAASVEEVSASIEEQMAGAEILANLARSLNEMAGELGNSVSLFKID